jgi:hypothetical protein
MCPTGQASARPAGRGHWLARPAGRRCCLAAMTSAGSGYRLARQQLVGDLAEHMADRSAQGLGELAVRPEGVEDPAAVLLELERVPAFNEPPAQGDDTSFWSVAGDGGEQAREALGAWPARREVDGHARAPLLRVLARRGEVAPRRSSLLQARVFEIAVRDQRSSNLTPGVENHFSRSERRAVSRRPLRRRRSAAGARSAPRRQRAAPRRGCPPTPRAAPGRSRARPEAAPTGRRRARPWGCVNSGGRAYSTPPG